MSLTEHPLRALMISKACYVAAYRRKLEELASAGVDLTLVVPPHWRFGRRIAPLEPGLDHGYRTIVRNPRWNGNHHLHHYPGIGRLLAEWRPAILHVDEEPYDFVTIHALLAARRSGARTVFFTWQNLARRFPPPFDWIEAAVLRRAGGAIAGNHAAAAILRDKGFGGPLAVIPQFGVDPDLFRPIPREKPGPVRIGYAGRLVPEKGLRVLAAALAELPGDWQLAVAGEGPLLGELKATFSRPSLAGRLDLVGAVPSTAMPVFLGTLDVLVLPSLTTPHWQEQFGRVLVEAMACEVAVVGSDSGEIPQVIGDAGMIVREGNAGALRDALAALAAQPARRAALGAAGRRRVLDRYTQRRIAEETIALYRQVLLAVR
ncbi:MAG: glycosyltransferase [Chloroflexi bacterium]|nr:glycosyltransferase [Chloroflexota bacterium]